MYDAFVLYFQLVIGVAGLQKELYSFDRGAHSLGEGADSTAGEKVLQKLKIVLTHYLLYLLFK